MHETKLQCLIVEDEPLAAEVLSDYIAQVSFLHLHAICSDAIFALETLNNHSIDVLFLDIHLPKLKGLEFLGLLTQKPQTILCTAYDQYAIDAFEIDVVDYLVKPISFNRFLKAVSKLQSKQNTAETADTTYFQKPKPFRFFNVNKKMVRVFYEDVLYVESLKDYVRIVMAQKSFVTKGQIGEMLTIFKPYKFLRIHRSFLVNLNQIVAYSANDVEIQGQIIPIGRSYKEFVMQALQDAFKEE